LNWDTGSNVAAFFNGNCANVENYFAGVDGCRGGWFIVQLGNRHTWNIELTNHIEALTATIDKSRLTLIDIPIGLLDGGGPHRLCDQEARRALGAPRAASVFPVPSRSAVYARSYEQACRLNLQRLGKKLSKQSWNISAKIQEIDQLLQQQKRFAGKLRESHPEIDFWALNNKSPMRFNKKKQPGREERLALLTRYLPQAADILKCAMDKYPRKQLASDDVLDAMVLAVTALFGNRNLHTLPAKPPKDQKNLAMEITYPVIDNNIPMI